ncbi:MAG: formyltransferase family protein [bacterium]|nr:formyltransferase family protein [bacterium]
MKKFPLVILIGGGSKLPALLEYERRPETKWRVARVVSHKSESPGVNLARENGIEAEIRYFDFKAEKRGEVSREEYSRKLGEDLSKIIGKDGLVVMAGWDLIMPEVFLSLFGGQVINLHPALLSDKASNEYVEVRGQKVSVLRGVHSNKAFKIALSEGHKWSGVTVHWVTPTVDVGKVILRGAVPIKSGDTVETLAERVHQKEDEILPQAIDIVVANMGIS